MAGDDDYEAWFINSRLAADNYVSTLEYEDTSLTTNEFFPRFRT